MNNNNTKKIWSPNIGIDIASEISKNFLDKCSSRKLLTREDLSLLQVYRTDKEWPLENLIEISRFFKFSKNDVPEIDRARESILRLLSAVIKAHFYFDEKSKVRNEPYIFSIPDIYKNGQFKYGIIYYIENNNKRYTLISSECDIINSNNKSDKINSWDKYSSIISNNYDDFFNIQKLKKIKAMDNQNYFNIKDWKSRKDYINIINEEGSIFSYGKLLKYEQSLRDVYNQISYIEWCKKEKSWFIPKGTDYKEILNFLENLKEKE